MRRALTPSEARLWSAIRRRATGARFRRQVPIGPWIADFASFDPRLVIEVDGPYHRGEDPTARTQGLRALGFTVLRFENDDVRYDLEGVFGTIEQMVEELRR